MLNKTITHTHSNGVVFPIAMKEERYRYGSGFDQIEDVMGVAQPVRFNSKPFIINVFAPLFSNHSAVDMSL